MISTPARRSGRLKKLLAAISLSFFLVLQAGAFQAQVQIAIKESGRKIKSKVTPEYPELALKTKITGTARVELVVTPDGSVKEVREIGGNPVLLSALVSAVKQWKYEPGPKETVSQVTAEFSR
jgi:TonB family protein